VEHAKRSLTPAFEYERSPLPAGEGFDQIRKEKMKKILAT
jgi:hypothetical protein